MFALCLVLFLGGIYVMGLSFNIPGLEGLLFVLGILMVSAALALPMAVNGIERRGDEANH